MLSSRALLLQTRVAFAAIVAAFVGLGLAIPVLVGPPVAGAERIHRDLGDAQRILTAMRGATLGLRSTVLLARDRDGAVPGPGLEEARARVERHAAELMRLVRELAGMPGATALHPGEIPELVRLAAATLDAAARGEPTEEVFRSLVVRSLEVDRTLEQLSEANTRAVTRNAERIHAGLRWLVIGCVSAAVAGGTGAVFLLRRTLALVKAYGTEKERRIADLDAFAARVAHDLRTPLQTIKLSVLKLADGADPGRARASERVERALERLDLMISDVLEYSRSAASAEAGRVADVSTVLADVREEMRSLAVERGVALRLRAPEGLPVAMSRAGLHSVVANLVQNGIKYARDVDDRAVSVEVEAVGDQVEVVVADNGVGIARQNLPSLFEPFFRGTDRRDSYGLGLATVKRILDSYGGSISVESTEGRGTTFTVRLRAAPGAPAREPAASDPVPRRAVPRAAPGGGPRASGSAGVGSSGPSRS
jgi:signal transduction histidine kinase